MVREQQGEKVGENCMVEQCLQSDTQARLQSGGKKRFGGRIMNHHGIKKEGLEQHTQPLKQVQVDDQSTPPSSYRSFIAYGGHDEPYAPALKTWKPLGTGFDTHTVPLCGAPANDLNRYLKSFRNKRKKHRKSSAKRAREKGRSRKR